MSTTPQADHEDAWRGFQGQAWRDQIDVRDFIVDNYTPYHGGSDFLSGPTVRTKQVWANLLDLMVVERERGILDVDAHTPSTITSHAPGHLEGEIIVGLQTDAPLKRAIMPNGGWRMVENGLKAYRLRARPDGPGHLHQVPQDPQRRASSTPTPRPIRAARGRRTSSPACRTPTVAAGSSATTGASRCTAWTG